MTSHEPPEDAREKQEDEDTEAILSRRRFLIFSTLAGAGIGPAMSGCQREPPKPKVCLKVPSREPEPPPPKDVLPPGPGPKVCVSVPREKRLPGVPPPKAKVCLTVPEP